jgi:hypothetical protein
MKNSITSGKHSTDEKQMKGDPMNKVFLYSTFGNYQYWKFQNRTIFMFRANIFMMTKQASAEY